MTGLAAPLKIRAETPMRSRSRVARPTLTETWFYCSPSHPRCPLPLLGIRSSSSSPHPHLFPISSACRMASQRRLLLRHQGRLGGSLLAQMAGGEWIFQFFLSDLPDGVAS
uniref:Uncharacterized protein n=1 Tax=Oryza glumipatula TaxID=40148 RepID=A0A0D9ZR57_9ORYZ